jgi:hypothetical protein
MPKKSKKTQSNRTQSKKNEEQKPNDRCACGSKKKYKKCCKNKKIVDVAEAPYIASSQLFDDFKIGVKSEIATNAASWLANTKVKKKDIFFYLLLCLLNNKVGLFNL